MCPRPLSLQSGLRELVAFDVVWTAGDAFSPPVVIAYGIAIIAAMFLIDPLWTVHVCDRIERRRLDASWY